MHRRNQCIVLEIEGFVVRKDVREGPRLEVIKQVIKYADARNYVELKEMTCDRHNWKAANQSRDCS